eukprot:m.51313 g.51313  ORF g.51313 m.51313 type:complete len:198 (+) comp12978_c0_seq1:43-636(+)
MSSFGRIVTLHPLSKYQIRTKTATVEREKNGDARLQKMREDYAREGMRRSVEAVMVVDDHRHPHILLLQPMQSIFKLPAGDLTPGETEQEGLNRILNNWFCPEGKTREWPISDLVATWWRPNFEFSMYPYVPPHATKMKEHKQVFLIQLPPDCTFEVPSNFKLIAVPLIELFDKKEAYGHVITSLPQLLSRYTFVTA